MTRINGVSMVAALHVNDARLCGGNVRGNANDVREACDEWLRSRGLAPTMRERMTSESEARIKRKNGR